MQIRSKSAFHLELIMLRCNREPSNRPSLELQLTDLNDMHSSHLGCCPTFSPKKENLFGRMGESELFVFFKATVWFGAYHRAIANTFNPSKKLTGVYTSALSQFCLRNENGY